MTSDAVKAEVLEIVAKYDKGYYTHANACDALWELAQKADTEDRAFVRKQHTGVDTEADV